MAATQTIQTLKRLIWIYFWLLIFEGALRKWIVPQLATPLLIARDPVVIYAYFLALKEGLFPRDRFTTGIIVLGFLSLFASIVTAIAAIDSNLAVIVYGLRTNFLHLPFIFLVPRVFSRSDVINIGRWVLILTVPMAVLMVVQFYAPSSAFINKAATEGGAQITSVGGRVRPPGTFSYILGSAQYFSLVASFLLYGLTQPGSYPTWLLTAAGFGTVSALAVSGSRTALASVVVVVMLLLIGLLLKPGLIAKSYNLLLLGAVIILGLSSTTFFSFLGEGVSVFSTRIENAGANEGGGVGFVARFLEGFTEPFAQFYTTPLLGYGLGMGTGAGAALMNRTGEFLLAEGEWARVILESGPILGLAYIICRLLLVAWLGWICFRVVSYSGNILPLLLFGACALIILNGQFGFGSTLGFAAFIGGLCLAACRTESPQLVMRSG